MNRPATSHAFSNRDIGRIMAAYGNKPDRQTKAKINSNLKAQKSKFVEMARIREAKNTRTNKRSL